MKNQILLSLLVISSYLYPDDNIQQALNFQLQPTTLATSCQTNSIATAAYKKIHEAKYDQALQIIINGLYHYPNDFSLQIDFGTIIGDFADTSSSLSDEIKENLRQKSKNCFEKLMTEVDGQPKNLEFYLKNEYGWRFRQHKYQYENGINRAAYYSGTDEWNTRAANCYYFQGVGAAHYAKELLKAGDKQSSALWAQKSLVAWAQYFSYKNDYYNAYVHYALALGILGHQDEMFKALQKSADMIQSDLTYHEFKEIIDFINSLKN
jgi:hypothetical protein